MIERIIHYCMTHKVLVGLFVVALIGWGIYSMTRLPVDATPDITNNQVQVIALAPSLAVQEVESAITAPIEVAVASIPDIIELRSISRLGLSVVTVVFKDDVDVYWARQQLNERLKEAEEQIPEGIANIELAPISTGLGEIFQYRLSVDKGYEHVYDPMTLRTLQDWVVRREMLGTPGVADINSYGGFVKQYEVAVNPERLKGMGLTLTDIFNALSANNENTGSAYIEKNPTAYFIRGVGMIQSLEDIGQIVVKANPSGVPVLIRDVASVQYGNATRYGAFVVDTTEAVGGVVMMLKGANANEVTKNVEARMKTIQTSLPKGVHIESYLNRSDLVGRAIGTVSRNLVEGALIVIFILVLFLGNLRAGLIVASVIPLSMLFAFSLMNLLGVSGNLMSLGAIDFGLIVDGAVIIVERVAHRINALQSQNTGLRKLSRRQMDDNVFESAKQMMSSATFGQLIILIVYVPILTLVGIEGKMFRPMAQVVSFALIGATLLSLTYVPVASSLFLGRKTKLQKTASDRAMDWLKQRYEVVLTFALGHKRAVIGSTLALFVVSLFLFTRLGGEFMPQLEEGDLAAGVVTLQGGSLSNTLEQVKKANAILLSKFPEIKHVVCKVGAGEIPTDPTPLETGDYIITLKDKKEWTSAKTREELVAKMEEALIPLAGVKFEFQQPIQMRQNELLSGSKQDITIKLFGDDLNTLAEKATEIERVIHNIEGVEDINVEKVTGLSQIQVTYNRERMAQYGLSVADANRVLRAAFAGSQAGVVYDEEKRFGLVVRLDKDYRQQLDDVRNLGVALPGGGQIPLEEIASVNIQSGPAQVTREDTKRRISVGFNVRNRDIQRVIHDVSRKLDASVTLPTGYYITYGGQFENLQAAKNRLALAVPIALLLIVVLLYFTFHSIKQTLLILTAVPLSLIGGILALWVCGMPFSISAGVGFIALFGIAVLNGIVLIAEFNRLEQEGVTSLDERIHRGLRSRLRPVIMTASVASMGFLPMAMSTSAGAEVQKPLATVVIGGLLTATLLTLIVLPILYQVVSSHSFRFNRLRGRFRPTLLVVGLLLGSAFISTAQTPQATRMPLQKAIDVALNNNASVQASTYTVETQKALTGAAWDIPKTTIEGSYGQVNSAANDNSLTLKQSFAFPTVYIRQKKLAKAAEKGAERQHEAVRLNMATQVKQAYWEWVYLSSKTELYRYQDSLLNKALLAAEQKVRSGETDRLEALAARSQRLEAANRWKQAQTDKTLCGQKLQALLNVDYPVIPADTALLALQSAPASLEANPDMSYARQQIDVSRAEHRLEQSQALPDLSIGVTSQTMKGVTPSGFGNRLNAIEIGVALPLWYGSFTAKKQAAEKKVRSAQAQADHVEATLKSQYSLLQGTCDKLRDNVRFYESQALPEASLLIEQATLRYQAGAIDYLDYATTLNQALLTRHNYLDALYQYNQTVIELDFVTGKTDSSIN